MDLEIQKRLGLKLSDKSINDSIMLGCSFWETPIEDVYISNYDILTHDFLNADLRAKDMVIVFKKTKDKLTSCYLSMQYLQLIGSIEYLLENIRI